MWRSNLLFFVMFLQAKEWLCLNCQTQRALKGIEPPGQPTIKFPYTAQQISKDGIYTWSFRETAHGSANKD